MITYFSQESQNILHNSYFQTKAPKNKIMKPRHGSLTEHKRTNNSFLNLTKHRSKLQKTGF